MFSKIVRFELRYQLKNPVFWVALVLFFLLTFGLMASQNITTGTGNNIHKNSPAGLVQAQLVLSLFFMFVTTAFVANVVVRDDDTGFGPIIRSTRITKIQYLTGRFTGAALASAVAFLIVPLGLWVGSCMPWIDQETLGPNRLSDYLYGFVVFGLPNLLVTGAIFFAAATITRSMMWTYVAVIVFFLAWFILTAIAAQKPEWRDSMAIIEPFGTRAFGNAIRYWTAAERNTMLPPVQGGILINRLIWLGVGLAALCLAVVRYRFSESGKVGRKSKAKARTEGEDARPVVRGGRMPGPAEPGVAAWAQLRARTVFEAKNVFKSPAFTVLMALGLINAGANLWFASLIYGTPTLPITAMQLPGLTGGFVLFPIIIAIYYSGELVWGERDRRMHEIIDATPVPNWAYIIPKTIAVALVLVAALLISVVGAILVQLAKGYTHVELGKYLLWYVVPNGFSVVMYAVLAVFVQSLSPNKYVGWAVMVVYIVAGIVLANLGFEHNLYNFPNAPQDQFSDMAGVGNFSSSAYWFRLYWVAFCVLLLVASHLLLRRGTETRLRPRLRRVPSRLRGTPGVIALIALLVFVGSGSWIFYNTNVLNTYRTSEEQEAFTADYEKKYLKYEKLPQPTISNVKLDVALYPRDSRALVKGSYVLTNLTTSPISEVHVRNTDRDLKILAIGMEGATLKSVDPKFDYRIYALDRPMQPGDRRSIRFETQRWQQGFRNSGNESKIVENGTFLNNFDLAPAIGMSRMGLLQERSKRRKYGLTPQLRPAKLEDLTATGKNYIGIGWTRADITLSTDADQVPIAPGMKVFDAVSGGRRTARFVSDAPILNFFSIQSAHYAERHRLYKGIDLAIYFHPAHAWNVDRMLNALERSLDYYQPNFGPYQFKQARILEFPGYRTFAQSFANTIPYSEAIGFTADTSDPDSIDYVTYVTAHELGHQYWAHQIVGADMQGATMLSETLAQYSALMVMKHLYGEDKIRRFLKFELDRYLRSRGGETVEEVPLERVEDQQYIHYNKGSLVMYLLQARIGEDKVNRALRTVLDAHKFKGAPYPRSIELVDAFRREAKTPEDQALITDLFERITLYDLKAVSPTAVKRSDGKWNVTVPVEAHKFYAAGKGNEKEAPLSDRIEIGLFTAEPGHGKFDRSNVIRMERLPVKSGKQVFRFVADRKPTNAGIDPYNFYIDRNSDDNVAKVG
ncbi:MAG: hypothetical protein JWP15_1490 [Alphaproteobacteria bacterium]|nr:hypothetical protein [Alphaproteobacteria bacterium]